MRSHARSLHARTAVRLVRLVQQVRGRTRCWGARPHHTEKTTQNTTPEPKPAPDARARGPRELRGRGGVGWQLMATWVTICEGTTPRRAVQGAPGPGACGRAAGLQFGGAGWWPWVHAWPDTSCWEIGTSLEIWLVLNTSASRGLAHAQTWVSGEPWDPGYRSGLGMPPSKHSSGQGRGLSMTRSI